MPPILTRKWLQGLKIIHFCSIALWMGGAAALLPILAMVEFSELENARQSYMALRSIAWNVIGWGGIGTVTTGLALAGLSEWGFFRYRWVTIKLFVAPAMVLFGMFFVEHHMLENLTHLEDGGGSALVAGTHWKVQAGLIVLLCAFVSVITLSVLKPWSASTEVLKHSQEEYG